MDRQLRTAPQGYGHVDLCRLEPGMHFIDVTTWCPMPSMQQRVQQWYIGGGPTLTSATSVKGPSMIESAGNCDKTLNRVTTRSDPGGSISLRMSCMAQGPAGCASWSLDCASVVCPRCTFFMHVFLALPWPSMIVTRFGVSCDAPLGIVFGLRAMCCRNPIPMRRGLGGERTRTVSHRRKHNTLKAILQHANRYIEEVTTADPRGPELHQRANERYSRKVGGTAVSSSNRA
jgi:hypothetical protein